MQAVVGQPLPMGSRVGWGLLTVVCTAAQFVLLHLTYNQLGWRQHSWLSCDPRRKHAAQQQELWRALNRYLAYSRSCMCILALSFVNGLALALTTNPAGSAGAVVLMPPAQARFLQDTPEDRMKEARVGVLVSVGLTVLPMLWLALARCAVHYGSQKMGFVATVTCVLAGLLPVSVKACGVGCALCNVYKKRCACAGMPCAGCGRHAFLLCANHGRSCHLFCGSCVIQVTASCFCAPAGVPVLLCLQ
jgi:hypothetical protein